MKIRAAKVNGVDGWVLDYGKRDGVRRRKYFLDRAKAEAALKQAQKDATAVGKRWTQLEADQRADVVRILGEIKAAGKTLRMVWEAFKSGAYANQTTDKTIGDAIKELLSVKNKAGRSGDYVVSLETILNQFANGREALSIAKVTLPDVEAWLDSKNQASRPTLRSRLSTLFKFAIRRGYRPDNPCERLESVTLAHKPPAIFTVEQMRQCLDFLASTNKPSKHSRQVTYAHALPWFVLTTCCGLRPEEAEKTTPEAINLQEGWIEVKAQTSKIRQRRVVYPPKAAIALLERVLKLGRLPLSPEARKRALRALRGALGWEKWPKDVTRHTAASYWLAQSQSASAVAESLGNSESVLRKNYKALVTKVQAAEFWQLVNTWKARKS